MMKINSKVVRLLKIGRKHPVIQPVNSQSCFDIKPLVTTPNNPDLSQADYFKLLGSVWRLSGTKKPFFLSADVTRRDHAMLLKLSRFSEYINTGIREQHTIAMAHGISVSDPNTKIIINSLDAFTYRSLDQLNAMVQGGGNAVIIADVAGLTNARNGRTHQSSGQPGAILTMPGITLLEPWDVTDTFNCLNWALSQKSGVVFIRIHSSLIDVEIPASVKRTVDQYVAFDPTASVKCCIAASGLTVGESVKAARALDTDGIGVRVINVVNQKKIDDLVLPPNRPVLTVYNGNSIILQSVIAMQAMRSDRPPSRVMGLGFDFGTTGEIYELMRKFQLDERSIILKIRSELI